MNPTLRDRFAMAALTGMMASEANTGGQMVALQGPTPTDPVKYKRAYMLRNAEEAFLWADAMMRAREPR